MRAGGTPDAGGRSLLMTSGMPTGSGRFTRGSIALFLMAGSIASDGVDVSESSWETWPWVLVRCPKVWKVWSLKQ